MGDAAFFTQFLADAKMASAMTSSPSGVVLPSVILAQWADETGYGSSLSSSAALWNFAGVSIGGSVNTFPTEQSGLDAYVQTLNLSYYNSVRQARGFVAQCSALGHSPWAGGHYDASNTGFPGIDLYNIIQQFNLTQYDPPGSEDGATGNAGLGFDLFNPASILGIVAPTPDTTKSPVGSLGPPQAPPPAGLTSDITQGDFYINGTGLTADVSGALVSAGLTLDITQASTVDIVLSDPDRTLINASPFQESSVLNLGGDLYELVAIQKQANDLTVTFEPWVIAAMRKAADPISVAPGVMTRSDFGGFLVSNIDTATYITPPASYLNGLQADGYATTQETLSRGTVDNPLESTWTCLQRLASEVGWRCFAVGSSVYFGPDSWLALQPPLLAIREWTGGVQTIDGTWDTGQPLGTLTVSAVAGTWTPPPGSVVAVANLGVLSGNWLVQSINRRSLFQPDITVTLCQPQPSLPEPSTGGAAAAATQQSSGGYASAQGVVTIAHGQLGKPYAWGGENPQTGFDCSGLMQWSYAQVGISIPRTSQAQQAAGPAVPPGVSNLLPGDLVFFGQIGVPATHVGMVVSTDPASDTAQMIDAPNSGAVVRIEGFTPDIGASWGADAYLGATRPAT